MIFELLSSIKTVSNDSCSSDQFPSLALSPGQLLALGVHPRLGSKHFNESLLETVLGGPEWAAEVAPDWGGGLRLLLRRSLGPLHLHRVGVDSLQAESKDREDEEEVELHTAERVSQREK